MAFITWKLHPSFHQVKDRLTTASKNVMPLVVTGEEHGLEQLGHAEGVFHWCLEVEKAEIDQT